MKLGQYSPTFGLVLSTIYSLFRKYQARSKLIRIKNKTAYDNNFIRSVMEFVKPPNVDDFHFTIKYGKTFSGFCYLHFNRIWVSLGNAPYPCLRNEEPRKGGHIQNILILSEEEYLMFLTAHELFHLFLRNTKRPQSERACDAYALREIREYRKLTSSDFYPNVYAETQAD